MTAQGKNNLREIFYEKRLPNLVPSIFFVCFGFPHVERRTMGMVGGGGGGTGLTDQPQIQYNTCTEYL